MLQKSLAAAVGRNFYLAPAQLIAQFISTQYWPLEERSIELRKERGNKKLGVFPGEIENTK